MLGQPVSMLIPRVVGFKLTGELPDGATATDLVLTITEMLREHGVVGKFVEFYGAGVSAVPLANRATIGNMSPEFGSTAAMFPIDEETITYLRADRPLRGAGRAGRGLRQGAGPLARRRPASRRSPSTSSSTSSTVVPSIAGPKRPQDRVAITEAKQAFREALPTYAPDGDSDPDDAAEESSSVDESVEETFPASDPASPFAHGNGQAGKPHHAVAGSGGAAARRPSRPAWSWRTAPRPRSTTATS